MELETQTIIARDLNYLSEETSQTLSIRTLEVNRILNGLINHFQEGLQAQWGLAVTCDP
jgi:four helix bundle protein